MSTDQNSIDELIKTVAIRHNISLSPDDPIMVLHTINRLLLSETELAQQALLKQFNEELQLITMKAGAQAKINAATLLQASINSSTQAINQVMEDNLEIISTTWNEKISNKYQSIKNMTLISIILSVITLTSIHIIFLVQFLDF